MCIQSRIILHLLSRGRAESMSRGVLFPQMDYKLLANVYALCDLQLKFGNDADFSPSNGRWNFNNKVLIVFVHVLFLLERSFSHFQCQ